MTQWAQRWRCETRDDIMRALHLIQHAPLPRGPVEIIVRSERVDKTHEQRKLFHAICDDIARVIGETPAAIKMRIKASFYGIELFVVHDRYGHEMPWADVPSSEESDREEYSRLIDHAYQWSAEAGVVIQDRRTLTISGDRHYEQDTDLRSE